MQLVGKVKLGLLAFRVRERKRGGRAGGGPCEYRHWHVRHDEPVWLGSPLLHTPPSPLSPSLSFSVSNTHCCPLKLWAPSLSLSLSLSLVLPVSHTVSVSLSSLCYFLRPCPVLVQWKMWLEGRRVGGCRASGTMSEYTVHRVVFFQFRLDSCQVYDCLPNICIVFTRCL